MLDIGLTIWAWRRGWKAWALLPLGIALPFMIILGAAGASTGTLVFFIIAEFGTLIYMVAKPRQKSQQATAANLNPVASVTDKPLSQPVEVEPATVIEPATVFAPVARGKLVLPDNSEISLTEAIRPIGRNDFDKAVSTEALKYISRQHLLITSDNGKYFVEDYDSANGTKTNGIDIKGQGRQELRDGDYINIADVVELKFKACELS